MKPIRFMGTTHGDISAFPPDARREAGFQLNQVQHGREPSDWKPMSIVGAGTYEIRIHSDGEWRVFYVAKFPEAIYVLHAFEKKTQKTPQQAIDLARKRYEEIP